MKEYCPAPHAVTPYFIGVHPVTGEEVWSSREGISFEQLLEHVAMHEPHPLNLYSPYFRGRTLYTAFYGDMTVSWLSPVEQAA